MWAEFSIFEEYKVIFEDILGEYKNFEINVELKSEVNPIFCKHSKIPFAHKIAVERELDILEENVVIKKSENCQ